MFASAASPVSMAGSSSTMTPKQSSALRLPALSGASRNAPRKVVCEAQQAPSTRRNMLQAGFLAAASSSLLASSPSPAIAGAEMDFKEQVVCDASCMESLDGIEMVKTASGLQYKDIVKGKGPSPPTGYQVTVHYTASTPEGKIFASSYEAGKPYDVRVGAGQIVAGLDEGIKSMQVGGKRRIFIPGNLAFPKGLASAPGRPRIPPNSPVVFDVDLLYIPGLEFDEEDYE